MTAIDTNVLVRIVTHDDPRQTEKALALLENDLVLIPVTVMLETEWVLRHCYQLPRAQIAHLFRSMLDTPGLVLDERDAVAKAVGLHAHGLDFADALHVSLAGRLAETLYTFDRTLARGTRGQSSPSVVLL